MKSLLNVVILFFICQSVFSQVVINELDCDTPGTDNMEFVELLSEVPNFNLDGFVLVFFNGSTSGGNSSYFTIDLDGFTTDINGLLLIGSNSVSPVPQLLISENVIQNGADAVAIYQANDFDFPEETVATIDNLIDVLIYDTSDADDIDMIDIFNDDPNFATIEQINEGSSNNTNSIQRFEDMDGNVTYTSTTPTPRQLNDGSGVVLNGISFTIDQSQYDETDSFDISFALQNPATDVLNFNILLDNSGFNTSDFSGNTAITIPIGLTNASTTITLIDDADDEGDEVARVRFESLPAEFIALNDNLDIRIVDNDFTVAAYGTPLSPTSGIVSSTQPADYYNTLDGLSDTVLRQALQNIIAEEGVVRTQTYADIIDILKEADQNPLNSNQVWLLYTEQGRPKLDFQTTSNNNGKWNREHTYPRSRGGFFDIEEDEIADGREVFWNTTADSLRHGNSDAHALRAADGPENSTRGNQHYGQYTGPVATAGSFYGDVARSVLYMAVRFNGLEVVNGFPEGSTGELGDLATLLDWHRNDPPDDFEMNRNNVIYTWQFNRNPFIDHPDLVEYIWGNNVGNIWDQPLGITEFETSKIEVYLNPTKGVISIKGLKSEAELLVFSIEGRKLKSFTTVNTETSIDLKLSSGIYMLKLISEEQTVTKKIIVK
ncbi:endonuclease [uncultured Psychroserpens sp.]|uniref:endonuclease n=1 Tax=uncultured Psychroserpens sp. TaxID=255436 RepID=UPI00262CF106|nr:endonuclease [uncultured Psychroserpens sp.]